MENIRTGQPKEVLMAPLTVIMAYLETHYIALLKNVGAYQQQILAHLAINSKLETKLDIKVILREELRKILTNVVSDVIIIKNVNPLNGVTLK